ncbi:MAG: PfkB family carbohydrate kinase [Chloroflexota bacterium]|nr:PfkB family carbohydrate kinase [Chloroflexota bacterium]
MADREDEAMIVVLGRPRVYRPEPDGDLAPGGLAVELALAVARGGADVELVGSIGDDPEGDRIVVELGRAGVGHSALLRDPATRTPLVGQPRDARPLPRLDAADVELGLRYLHDCRVLIVGAELDPEALAKAQEAADYHAAAVVMVAAADVVDPEVLGPSVTLLERPATEDAESVEDAVVVAADDADFAAFVADYALRLDRGESPAKAFSAALGGSAWEPALE